MTNEEKAQRLEAMAAKLPKSEELPPRFWGDSVIAYTEEHPDIPLLRESAALWRERDGVRWAKVTRDQFAAHRKGYDMNVFPSLSYQGKIAADISSAGIYEHCSYHETLDAAKAAAIQWVDAQEGK